MSTLPALVSVVVPAFNAERYLGECLESILGQSYPNLEVIVMDDASTDGTAEVARSFGARIRYHRQNANRGIYRNADDGIALAGGEFVAVYHADDVYLPEIVSRQVAWLEANPASGAAFCLDILVDERGREYGRLQIPDELAGERPLEFRQVFNGLLRRKNSFLVCPTSMVRAAVYRELGGYRQEMFANSADLDMWIRISHSYPIGILEAHLVRYRHFHDSSSRRYHHLRTTPERYFAIMDHHLAAGARAIALPDALRDYEAHRAQDWILIAAALYIERRRREMPGALARVDVASLLASPRIRRTRMIALYLSLLVLSRLPRIPFVASLFYRRWHLRKQPAL